MSDRLTSIRLHNLDFGSVADWGLKTHAEMVEKIKHKAIFDKTVAERILNAEPSEFIVETYIGVHAMKDKKVIKS